MQHALIPIARLSLIEICQKVVEFVMHFRSSCWLIIQAGCLAADDLIVAMEAYRIWYQVDCQRDGDLSVAVGLEVEENPLYISHHVRNSKTSDQVHGS